MTAKESLRRIIEGVTEEQAQDLLDYLNLRADPDTLGDKESRLVGKGETAIARGDFVTLDQLKRELA